jgi:ABC-type transporter Mla subunit MlaD
MPSRTVIEQLPPTIQEWLEHELLERGFAGYIELTDALNDKLAEAGLEITVSKSALHRFGQGFEGRVDALRRTMMMAQTIVRDLGDEQGAMNDAVIRLTQDRMFQIVLDEELDARSLNALAHAAADLSRASIVQKKHMASVRAKLGELEAAAQTGKRKLDPDTLREVRLELFGE